MQRRKLLRNIGVAGMLSIAGCSESSSQSNTNQWSSELTEDQLNDYGPANQEEALSFHPLDPLSSDTIDKLQSGGYIVYFRHEATQAGTDQQKSTEVLKTKRNATGAEDLNQTQKRVLNKTQIPEWNYDDCSLQRNLDIAGWRRAIGTGNAFDILDISVSQVLSSPWCRCFKTAQLAFHQYQTTSDLDYTKTDNRERLEPILQQEPKSGSNTALVAHSLGSMELGDVFDVSLSEGQCLVVDPSEPLQNALVDAP